MSDIQPPTAQVQQPLTDDSLVQRQITHDQFTWVAGEANASSPWSALFWAAWRGCGSTVVSTPPRSTSNADRGAMTTSRADTCVADPGLRRVL